MIKEMLIIISSSCLVNCANQGSNNTVQQSKLETINEIDDTHEIIKILYETDQAERSSKNTNWSQMSRNDRKRLRKVKELLIDSNKFTALDYTRAAMIFQHGGKSEEYKTAIQLMERAIELDSSTNQWLFFAATDRYLLSMNKPQIFGTQYTYSDTGKVTKAIDITFEADSIRNSYNTLPVSIKENLIDLKLIEK